MPLITKNIISKGFILQADPQSGSTQYTPTAVWVGSTPTDPYKTPPSVQSMPEGPPAIGSAKTYAPKTLFAAATDIKALLNFNDNPTWRADWYAGTFYYPVTDETGRLWEARYDGYNPPNGCDTSVKKFGAGSFQCGQVSRAYTTQATTDFDFAHGDFTVEGYYFFDAYWGLIPFKFGDGTYGIYLSWDKGSPDTVRFYVYDNSVKVIDFSGEMSLLDYVGLWVHIALVRYGNEFTIYVDGQVVATSTLDITMPQISLASAVPACTVPAGNQGFYSRVDDFVITDRAKYTAPFTPPTIEASIASDRVFCPPFGDQSSYFEVTHADLIAGGFAIHTGDFTIESRFRVDKKYEMWTGGSLPRYAIVGQYDDVLWAGDEDAAPGNWWSLEFYEETFRFKIWDATLGYIVNIYEPIAMSWAAAWSDPCHDKDNEDPSYVHIAVCRQGNTIRLFVNGHCTLATAEGTITDWNEIHKSLEINGQDGRLNPDIPYSITYVEELRTLDYALYWEDFTPGDFPFTQGVGIGIYPRLFPTLIKGIVGDMTANLPIPFNMKATLIRGLVGDLYAAFPSMAPQIKGWISSLTNFDATLDVVIPSLEFRGSGIINELGYLSIVIPSLEFSAKGAIDESGSLNVRLPRLSFRATAEVSEIGNFAVTIPMLKFAMSLVVETSGDLVLTIPMQSINFTGGVDETGNLAVTLPMLLLSFLAEPQSYLNMVMNIKNRALTLYANYPFNSLCRFNGIHLGMTENRIYDLDSGETDDGTLIDWNFRTGYLDLDQKIKLKLRQAWFSYKSNGDLIITVVQPDGTEYEYDLTGYEITEDGLRVKFGKGLGAKYVALDVKNVDGSSMTLDTLRLNFDKFKKER